MEIGIALLVLLVGLGAGALAATHLARRHEAQLRDSFQALSAEALRQNNQSFLDLARASMGEFQQKAGADLDRRREAFDALVKPIGDTLQKMGGTLGEIEKERHGHYSKLTEQMRAVGAAHEQLRAETGSLVRALRTPHVRGNWGELQLKQTVEKAGMVEYVHFVQQETKHGEGGRLRPDMTILMPGGQQIVVDAKVPLQAYMEAHETTDEAERETKLKDHARVVRQHMSQLAAKSYWSQFDNAPEFVVMFMPMESLFSAALQTDPGLLDFAVEQGVVLASPVSLITMLRTAAYSWREERLAENARQISELGKELHDRIGSVAGHFTKLGGNLDKAVDAYNKAVGSMESRVFVSARRFKELGAASGEIDTPPVIERQPRRLELPDPAVLADETD